MTSASQLPGGETEPGHDHEQPAVGGVTDPPVRAGADDGLAWVNLDGGAKRAAERGDRPQADREPEPDHDQPGCPVGTAIRGAAARDAVTAATGTPPGLDRIELGRCGKPWVGQAQPARRFIVQALVLTGRRLRSAVDSRRTVRTRRTSDAGHITRGTLSLFSTRTSSAVLVGVPGIGRRRGRRSHSSTSWSDEPVGLAARIVWRRTRA
jgi:hypothetical protein